MPRFQGIIDKRFSCCLKIKSVENILGYILQIFEIVPRKYPKMVKIDFIFREQKIEFIPECQALSCYCCSSCRLAVLPLVAALKLVIKSAL